MSEGITGGEADIHLAIDIGVHAANEGFRSIWEAIERLPDNATKVMASAVVAGIIRARMDIMSKGMDAVPGFNKIVEEVAQKYSDSEGEKIIANAFSKARTASQH